MCVAMCVAVCGAVGRGCVVPGRVGLVGVGIWELVDGLVDTLCGSGRDRTALK